MAGPGQTPGSWSHSIGVLRGGGGGRRMRLATRCLGRLFKNEK